VVKAMENHTGNLMAYVLGYDWSQGVWGLEKSAKSRLLVHIITP
jgi:hypothetical protein